jgi:hypothetical protein
VETGSNVALALLCSRTELLEVLCSLWDHVVEEIKIDPTALLCGKLLALLSVEQPRM